MKLSLSGRLWESPKGCRITLPEHIAEASRLGYQGIELRYPLLPTPETIPDIQAALKTHHIQAVFAFCAGIPKDTAAWEDTRRVIQTVQAMGGTHVRLALIKEEDIAIARAVADFAAHHHLRVVLHVHAGTLCDSADKTLAVLQAIHHPHVGLLLDPIHLVLTGEHDITAAINRLGPHIELVNLQNFRPAPDNASGAIRVENRTWFPAPPGHPDGLDFKHVLTVLRHTGYNGWLNVMCATTPEEDPPAVAREYYDHLAGLLHA